MNFSIANSDIAHERVDDEVIVVNLQTGAYFSFRGVAADVWSLLTDGVDVDAIAAHLAETGAADVAVVRADVAAFADQLAAQGLLVVSDAAAPTEVVWPHGRGEYEKPVVEKFEDMEELLLLDPIHEVDDAGWPVIAVEPGTIVGTDD